MGRFSFGYFSFDGKRKVTTSPAVSRKSKVTLGVAEALFVGVAYMRHRQKAIARGKLDPSNILVDT
ncbi:MAG: hypothetical protein ABUK01_09980 [Leptospirales bacterium]